MAIRPSVGEVFRHPILWKREGVSGETKGRKKRPVSMAVAIARRGKETLLGR